MFTLALVSLVFTSTQAQKQLGGEHNIEVNFAPFAAQPFGVLSFGDSLIGGPSIKYRNFLDDDKALRFTLMLNNSSDNYTYRQPGEQNSTDPVSPQLGLGTSSFSFGLAAGYEMHFDGTDNLSPYFGVEAFFMTNKRNDFMEIHSPNDVVNADPSTEDALNNFVTWELGNSQSINRFGLNLMLGADYYFNDAIYVGFEAGLGIGITKVGDHIISATDKNAFHILFNHASSYDPNGGINGDELTPTDIIGQELDTYTGYLPFDATVFDLYTNSDVANWGDQVSENPDGLYTVSVDQNYDDVSDSSLLSGLELGIIFNPAIRIGFLFD